MTKRLLIVGFLILSVLVLSCGPTAGPRDADGASSDSAEAQPTPTYTPWPTKPTSTPAPDLATKPPLHTPAHEPPPEHPGGLAGCKALSVFSAPGEAQYIPWCGQELCENIRSTCSNQDTHDNVLACAESIVSGYTSTTFRLGPAKRSAKRSRNSRLAAGGLHGAGGPTPGHGGDLGR